MSGHWKFSVVTWLLIGLSCLTVPPLILVAGVVLVCWLTEPASFPGDPNIGLGLLRLAAMLNLPTFLGWSLWLASRL